jgi:hypothetical protein
MPKRILVALGLVALALAACNSNYNPNYLYGTPTPAPTPTPSTTPNPSITTATVTVEYSSSPLPNQPVQLSNAVNGSGGACTTSSGCSVGTPIGTPEPTNASGQASFTNLTGAAFYCFSTTFTPPLTGALPQTQSYCTDLWGSGILFSF